MCKTKKTVQKHEFIGCSFSKTEDVRPKLFNTLKHYHMHLGTLNIVSSGYPRLWNPSNLHIWWHSGFRGWLRNPSSKEGILQPTWTAGRCVTLSSLEFPQRSICVFPTAASNAQKREVKWPISLYLLCFLAGPTKKVINEHLSHLWNPTNCNASSFPGN